MPTSARATRCSRASAISSRRRPAATTRRSSTSSSPCRPQPDDRGPGGPLEALPFRVEHGPNYEALGFRFGGLAYLPDVSLIPPAALEALADLDVLILDCLREKPHVSHFHLAQSLETIAALKPRRAVLTNLHVDLDYASLSSRLPADVEVAFDGMRIATAG